MRDISHIVLKILALPLETLGLRGSDLVAPVVGAYRSAVGPYPRKTQIVGAVEGDLAVDVYGALNLHSARRNGVVLNEDIVHAGLGNVYLPRNLRRIAGVEHVGQTSALVHDIRVLSLGKIGRIDRECGLRDGRVLIFLQILYVGIVSAESLNVGRKIVSRVFFGIILFGSQVLYHNDKDYHCDGCR